MTDSSNLNWTEDTGHEHQELADNSEVQVNTTIVCTIRGELHSQTIGAKQSSHIESTGQEIKKSDIQSCGKYHKRMLPRAIVLGVHPLQLFIPGICLENALNLVRFIEVQRYTRGTRDSSTPSVSEDYYEKMQAQVTKWLTGWITVLSHRAFLDWQKWRQPGRFSPSGRYAKRTSFAKIRMLKEMMNLRRICPCMKAEMSGQTDSIRNCGRNWPFGGLNTVPHWNLLISIWLCIMG